MAVPPPMSERLARFWRRLWQRLRPAAAPGPEIRREAGSPPQAATTTPTTPDGPRAPPPAPAPRRSPAGGVRRIGLALQGGGSHGAFTWGVLDRLLDEPRLEIAAISGTSAGALNAGVLASGLARGGREGARAALRAFWLDVSRAGAAFSPPPGQPRHGQCRQAWCGARLTAFRGRRRSHESPPRLSAAPGLCVFEEGLRALFRFSGATRQGDTSASIAECMGDGAQVDILEFAADRHAARQPRDTHTTDFRVSATTWAVTSPSAVKFVATITSCTTPSEARSSKAGKPMSCTPTPSSGLRRPMSTK